MRPQDLFQLALFGGVATALPKLGLRMDTAANQIAAIMPDSTSCDGADFPDECRTAEQAAPFLINAMVKYKVYSLGEIAGVLSLIGFESVDMKYKHNAYPGRPGQVRTKLSLPTNNLIKSSLTLTICLRALRTCK